MEKSRATSQEVIFFAVGFLAIIALVGLLLNFLYPLAYERELARRPMSTWLKVYALGAFLLSFCVVAVSLVFTVATRVSTPLASVYAGALTVVALGGYSVLVLKTFPAGIGIEILDILNAKLLAEWQVVKFLGVMLPSCAILAGALTWIHGKLLVAR